MFIRLVAAVLVYSFCVQPVFATELSQATVEEVSFDTTTPLDSELSPEASADIGNVSATEVIAETEEVVSTLPTVDVRVETIEVSNETEGSAAIQTVASSPDETSFAVEEAVLYEKTVEDLGKKEDPQDLSYVPGEVLVKFKTDALKLTTASGQKTVRSFAAAADLTKVTDIGSENTVLFSITDDLTVKQKIAELKKNPHVEYVEPNYLRYPATIPTNDTLKGELWALDNEGQVVTGFYGFNNPGSVDSDIDAPEAWAIGEGVYDSTIVAVIDSGVAYNHPDLENQMWDGSACKDDQGAFLGGCVHGYDFADEDTTPLPGGSAIPEWSETTAIVHGTHVAGIIAAQKNNGTGVVGVAPKAKIMALRMGYTVASIARAIDFARENGARIINASYAGPFYSSVEYEAMERFLDAGGLFVAAAGNANSSNDATPQYPASYTLSNVIAVAATDQSDARAVFSNFGAESVDVGAPGVNILSTVPHVGLGSVETFEGVTPPLVPAGWVQAGSGGVWGTVDIDGGAVWGNVLFSDTDTPYRDNSNTTITSPALDIHDGQSLLSFWTVCDTEYDTSSWQDFMQLEWSHDGSTFVPAEDTFFGEALRWDEFMLDFLNGDSFNDAGSAVREFLVPIPSTFSTANFMYRFRWVTDGDDNAYDGCFVDDVTITRISDGGDNFSMSMGGTSMAAPQVTGLVALIWGHHPSLSADQVKDIVLTTGDTVPDLVAKTVTGKRINAHNALQVAHTAHTITSFTIPEEEGGAVIDQVLGTIALTVPFGTDLTHITPTLISTGVLVSPASGIPQNFTAPVVYTVTARSGAVRTYTVTVTTLPQPPDVTAPVITLFGGNTMGITQGTVFIDPGATALDDRDGDLTSAVLAVGGVDTATPGTYTITYSVSDVAGNSASAVRTVVVSAPASSGGGGGGGSGGGGAKRYAVTINKDARETNNRAVTLTITPVKGLTQMRVAHTESDLAETAWFPLKEIYAWELTPALGKKVVYVQYGKNNKATRTVKDDIVLVEGVVESLPRGATPLVRAITQATSTTYVFAKDFGLGTRSADVVKLQEILIKGGYLKLAQPTDYFGPMTHMALKLYQRESSIPQTGVVDLTTRAVLNKIQTSTQNQGATTGASHTVKIETLQAQLKALLEQLAKMKK